MSFPTVDPPAGHRWELRTGLSMNPGDPDPGLTINRWPANNGQTPRGYASGWTDDLPSDLTWRFEAWRYIQFQVWVGGVKTELGAIQPGVYTGFQQGAVAEDGVGLTVGGDGKPTWSVMWLGGPGPDPPSVATQMTDIVGDAWVAVLLGSGITEVPPAGCAPTNLNNCGGALHPLPPGTTSPTAATEAAAARLRIEWRRAEQAADAAGPDPGAVAALTWPRTGLTGGSYLLARVQRHLSVTHSPPSSHSKTTNTFVKIPGFDVEGGPLYATVDVTPVDGPLPIV